MARDDTKLQYSSAWEIDQLVDSDTVDISASGDTTLIDFSSLNLPDVPVFEVQFKPSGSSSWYQAGNAFSDDDGSGSFSFYAYITGTTLKIHTSDAGTARYFLWSDKVDYT